MLDFDLVSNNDSRYERKYLRILGNGERNIVMISNLEDWIF